jgi:DNA-binding transcriptional LysR family regulator
MDIPKSLRSIRWDDLRIFLAIARSDQIAGAAKLLQIDQSTVSRRIAQMESDLGLRLVERKRDRLYLTEFGRNILKYVETIDTQVSSILDLSRGVVDGAPPLVRISTYEGLSTLYLAERLAAFQLTQPPMRIEIVTQLRPVNVAIRDADLFISFYEPDGRGLQKEQLGTLAHHLFASRAYLDAEGSPANRADLSRHRFVSFIPDLLNLESARFLDEIAKGHRDMLNSTSMGTQMAAAAVGAGIVMLPVFAARTEPRLIPVLQDEIAIERGIWVSTHQDLRYTARIKTLIGFLKKIFKADHDHFNKWS